VHMNHRNDFFVTGDIFFSIFPSHVSSVKVFIDSFLPTKATASSLSLHWTFWADDYKRAQRQETGWMKIVEKNQNSMVQFQGMIKALLNRMPIIQKFEMIYFN
jgi:hypothetical protein